MKSFLFFMFTTITVITVAAQNIQSFIQSFNDEVLDSEVKLFLYTRKNPNNSIDAEDIDIKKPTKIIVHAFLEDAERAWLKNITREYLKKGDYNVILVDWSLTATEDYISAALKTKNVGRYIVKHKLPLTTTHLVGHSLGAHVCGAAGREVRKLTGQKLFRISALDAARPLFEGANPEPIQKSDALIVDAIHTDGGALGFKKPFGTVDFYPNGGTPMQPGCDFQVNLAALFNLPQTLENIFCSHIRSHFYFTSSINDEKFVATKCSSWRKYLNGDCNDFEKAVMGDDYDLKARGKFYLKTNGHPPYAYDFKN